MRNIILLGLFLLTLLSCEKENIKKEEISGKWKYDSYRYLRTSRNGNVSDTIINSPGGIIEFTNDKTEENRGGTIYGDFASGNARIPLFYDPSNQQHELPASLPMENCYMLLGKNSNPKTESFDDHYQGLTLFGIGNGANYSVYTTYMYRVDNNTINVKFILPHQSQNGIYLTLTK